MSFTSVVSHCGNDHAEWIKNIEFYRDELRIFTTRLEEIVKKNTGMEAMTEAEHFQNLFIIQQNNIDELKHAIGHHNSKAADDSKEHAGRIKTLLVIEHEDLQKKMDEQDKLFQTTRKDFNKYLSKWM